MNTADLIFLALGNWCLGSIILGLTAGWRATRPDAAPVQVLLAAHVWPLMLIYAAAWRAGLTLRAASAKTDAACKGGSKRKRGRR